MGKINENRQQKLEALERSAYHLFIEQGIEKTSISDITKKAGVAKGTFYLYFKDKYELRDHLIVKNASELFLEAWKAFSDSNISEFEDGVIFIIDSLLDKMITNKPLLRFISKNLSWGIFHQALLTDDTADDKNVMNLFRTLLFDNPSLQLKEPEIMIFLIIELVSSTSFSTILENDPMPFEEIKPYLHQSIRSIIQNHKI